MTDGVTRTARGRAARQVTAVAVASLVLLSACQPSEPDAPAEPDGSPTSAESDVPSPTPSPPAPSPTPTPTPTPTPSPSPSDEDAAPAWTQEATTAWAPGEGEVLVEAKLTAAAVVERLTTYDPADSLDDRLVAVAGDATTTDLLSGAVEVDHPGAWSRGQVVYPQAGGFAIGADPDTGIVPSTGPVSAAQTAAVMVVVEQRWGTDDDPTVERRTVDVRLARDAEDDPWRLVAVPSAGGVPVERPDDAHPVLDDDRVTLPDSARWDIAAGRIDEQLLDLLVDTAATVPIEVAVLGTGHPSNVFATDRISAHTAGRAADIHTVDGVAVASSHALDSPTRALVERLYGDDRVRNIGSPWALDGFGGRSFTDITHADHVHVAVRPSAG